ncbi:MAG TPA: dihydropteroate synthase [Solirubrobacteraceae bacterium]|jgi:dihydropteroate synthase|nr:dihydropteroate synthase [Solirubrobacteraceae bacterium]
MAQTVTSARHPGGASNFVARGKHMDLYGRPVLMGVLNATPDSFSDAGLYRTVSARVDRGLDLIADGADIIDIGGESAVTNRPAVAVDDEISRVVPVIEGLLTRAEVVVSVDTYKPAVASAAIAAGASIVNDISGLAAPELADICAVTGAALVVMHNRGVPKQRLVDPDLYIDVVEDVLGFLREQTELAERHGVSRQSLIVDPGPDFSKTPAQTIEVLRNVESLSTLGFPVLLPISRKDFIGALLGKPPRERLAGTLAALDHGLSSGVRIFRVHDVAEAKEFLDTRLALAGRFRSPLTKSER